jgi:hypothetical protein
VILKVGLKLGLRLRLRLKFFTVFNTELRGNQLADSSPVWCFGFPGSFSFKLCAALANFLMKISRKVVFKSVENGDFI